MSYPYPYPGPELFTCEAQALERETIAETERLSGCIGWGPCGPYQAQYARLREAATKVVEIAWMMQDPAREDPYAELGAAIIDNAKQVLETIRDFRLLQSAAAENKPS